jgi:hypothetical protein
MKRIACCSSHLSYLSVIALVGSGLLLSGCGGTSPSTTNSATSPSSVSATPSGSPTGSGSNSGGSGTSGGSTGGTTGGSGDSATSISGTIVNSQTGAPVNGTVAVGLEGANPSDFTIMAQTTADAQGHFVFNDVQPSPRGWGWTIAVAAESSDGTMFAQTLLVSHNLVSGGSGDAIEPGTDVGTITLSPSPSGKIEGTVFSDNSSGAGQSVNVTIDPLRTFTFDRHFSVPWLSGAPQFTTKNDDLACAGESSACSTFVLTVPTARVWVAIFNHTGNQFQSVTGGGNDYSAIFNATSPGNGTPDCNPSSAEHFFMGPDASGNSSNNLVHFQSCTP